MRILSTPSVSDKLSLDETINRLAQSPLVDGIAEFGSRTAQHFHAASDYDLLVLVTALPTKVFQMVTTIGGRLADIVLVETSTADALLATGMPPIALFEILFARKMQIAHIRYDQSNRLSRMQQMVTSPEWKAAQSVPAPNDITYAAWFWQSFGLLHLERMAQSSDLLHLTAVDMMLTACLSGTWRSYFDIRGLPWEGEKAALRYWMQHDDGYLKMIKACLEETQQATRLVAYRALVRQTLLPIGEPLHFGETAVVLTQSDNIQGDVETILGYWDGLVGAM